MAHAQGFPNFSDGNVLILAPHGKSWRLNASALKLHSRAFRSILVSVPATPITAMQRMMQNTVQWRVKMVRDRLDERFVTFEAMRSQDGYPDLPRDDGRKPHYLSIYDNLFKCMYNIDPVFDGANMSTLTYHTCSLLQAAEMLGGAACVRRAIESHLLRMSQQLWIKVHNRPQGWADMAIRLRSPAIFREAMIHLTGRWKMQGMVDKESLRALPFGAVIEETVVNKIREYDRIKMTIEDNLLTLYPPLMLHPSTGDEHSGRAVYANDIYMWQALSLVRHYIMTSITSQLTYQAADGGATFYRQIGEGGAAYLTHEILDDFHEYFSMTLKGRDCLSNALYYVKRSLTELVAELLTDRTMLITTGNEPFAYLTNFNFTDEELPWHTEVAEEEYEEDSSKPEQE